jgi:hypothetical protein
LLNRGLASLGYRLVRIGRNDMSAVTALRRELGARIEAASGGTVMTGPFAGMRLPPVDAWGANDRAPRLLGTYEADLHAALEAEIARKPDWILNVGAADGYYAVGLARRIPDARVLAYDPLPEAREATRRAAALNGVEAQFAFEGAFSPQTFPKLAPGNRAFMFVDCEGCEASFCTAMEPSAFAQVSLLIESHEFIVPGISARLAAHFAATHFVTTIREGGRDPNRFEILRKLGSFERWLAVTEDRPEAMEWLWIVPKAWG